MPKSLSLGTILSMEDPTSTWTPVGNLTSIGAPGPVKGETEVTDYDSTAREFLSTLPDNGEISFEGFWVQGQAGQEKLWTDAINPAAPTRAWRLDFVRQNARFTFSGYVKSFVPAPGSVDDAYTFSGSIRVSGAVVKTSPIP